MNLYNYTVVLARHIKNYEIPVSMQGFDSNSHKLCNCGWNFELDILREMAEDLLNIRVKFENETVILISETIVKPYELLLFADNEFDHPFKNGIHINKIITR